MTVSKMTISITTISKMTHQNDVLMSVAIQGILNVVTLIVVVLIVSAPVFVPTTFFSPFFVTFISGKRKTQKTQVILH
jgi:hypothetical protein